MSSTVVSGLQTLSCSSLPGIVEEVLLTDGNCKQGAVEHIVQRQEARYTPAPGSQLCSTCRLMASFDNDRKPEKKNLEHFKELKTYKVYQE